MIFFSKEAENEKYLEECAESAKLFIEEKRNELLTLSAKMDYERKNREVDEITNIYQKAFDHLKKANKQIPKSLNELYQVSLEKIDKYNK